MKTPEAVLVSIHPRHANKILSGEKRLEFRRVWTSAPVKSLAIYATTPIQGIVGIARVKTVHKGSPTSLWQLAKQFGGGISRRDLYSYFNGKNAGYAIELDDVASCFPPLEPTKFFEKFTPPQSFLYLDQPTFVRIEKAVNKQPRRGKVLFIAGVHGVGKTTLCRSFAQQEGILHKSSSELIREARDSSISRNSKMVKDIPENQRLLVEAVQRIRESGQTLMLDGHFALLDSNGKVESLSTSVFADLGIDGVILVTDSPLKIKERIKSRDDTCVDSKDVDKIQVVETNRASQVANEIGVPLATIKSCNQNQFNSMIRHLRERLGGL